MSERAATGGGLTAEREGEIRAHVEREILPTADEVKGILRSGWKPSDRLQLRDECVELLAEIDRLRADQERLQGELDAALMCLGSIALGEKCGVDALLVAREALRGVE